MDRLFRLIIIKDFKDLALQFDILTFLLVLFSKLPLF